MKHLLKTLILLVSLGGLSGYVFGEESSVCEEKRVGCDTICDAEHPADLDARAHCQANCMNSFYSCLGLKPDHPVCGSRLVECGVVCNAENPDDEDARTKCHSECKDSFNKCVEGKPHHHKHGHKHHTQ